jgi:hypothetical protein
MATRTRRRAGRADTGRRIAGEAAAETTAGAEVSRVRRTATELGHKVTVPDAADMPDEIFRLHVRLRHSGLWRTAGASRVRHEIAHRCAPRGLWDHSHLEPEEED